MIRKTFGALAVGIGLAIFAWIAYNLVHPTREFRRVRKSPFQLLIPGAMLWVGWRWLRHGGPGLEEQEIDWDAPELRSALIEAQRTMPLFLAEVGKSVDNAFVKFPFTTDTGVVEHVWAYVHHYHDRKFNVSIASQPHSQKAPLEGRRDVDLAEVEDWQIMLPDGKIRGGQSMIGAFRFLEARGKRLNRTLREQRAQLVDA